MGQISTFFFLIWDLPPLPPNQKYWIIFGQNELLVYKNVCIRPISAFICHFSPLGSTSIFISSFKIEAKIQAVPQSKSWNFGFFFSFLSSGFGVGLKFFDLLTLMQMEMARKRRIFSNKETSFFFCLFQKLYLNLFTELEKEDK